MNTGIAREWVGDHYYHLIKVILWIGRQNDSGIFNVSSEIKTNNDNQFLISKYGFFKFCLMSLAILKLTYSQFFFFLTKCTSLNLTEFLYCYRDCCLVSTRDLCKLKPTTFFLFSIRVLFHGH